MYNKHDSILVIETKKYRNQNLPAGIIIWVVANNNSIITRAPSEHTSVTHMVLHITNHSTFRDGSDGEHITDNKIGLLPAVDELAGVHTLGGDEELLLVLVAEGVAEGDAGKRGTPARIVDDLADHALEVAISLAEVQRAKPGRALPVVGVRPEN